MFSSPKDILKKYWGYSEFRLHQEEIIANVLNGKDTIALMPTGGGKSLCYQIPALAKKGVCIVVSPLVALMQDQVQILQSKNIKALHLSSGLSLNELEKQLDNIEYGNYKFLYLSPERLQQELVKIRIKRINVSLIAIDEAHCISEWGHDFRPAYLNLKELKEIHPNIPTIAVTATATSEVQRDIIKHLELKTPKIYKSSYLRKNLSYGIYKTQDKKYLLHQILKKQKGCAIIYVATRSQTLIYSDFLSQNNITALPYHGGLSNTIKSKNFNQWKNNKTQVIVATNAFGMGIDKEDVRIVIHLHLPMSIENYFQEAGRAGRDGKQAYALLLKTGNTKSKLIQQFEAQTPTITFIKKVYRKLSSYLQISYGEGCEQDFTISFREFCERYQFYKGQAYSAFQILDKQSILRFKEIYTQISQAQFLITSSQLQVFIEQNISFKKICEFITRNYEGVFRQSTNVDLSLISSKTSISQDKVLLLLEKLHLQEIILFKNHQHDIAITYLRPREDNKAINSVSKHIKKQLKNKEKKIKDVVTFLENETECRSKLLLAYFEEDSVDCGICSNCIKKQKRNIETSEIIVSIVKILTKKNYDSRTLIEKLPIFEADDIIDTLKKLLSDNKIKINPDNTYSIKN